MTTASARGRNNRRRGQAGEREVCALIADALGIAVQRNLGQERDSGSDISLPPYTLEVKRRKAVANLYAWLEQAGSTGGRPIAAVRADGREWLAVMPMSEFLRLVREEVAA